jgi:hypothetical protein
MKITIQPLGGGEAYLLCEGADRTIGKRCGPQGFRKNGRRLLQEEDIFRADAAWQFDRGNRRTVVAFGVSVLFATLEEAEAFVLLHSTELPGQGVVTFEAGTQGATRTMTGTIVADDVSYVGASVQIQYEIHGRVMAAGT